MSTSLGLFCLHSILLSLLSLTASGINFCNINKKKNIYSDETRRETTKQNFTWIWNLLSCKKVSKFTLHGFIFQYYSRRLEFRGFCYIFHTVNWFSFQYTRLFQFVIYSFRSAHTNFSTPSVRSYLYMNQFPLLFGYFHSPWTCIFQCRKVKYIGMM
jgi:hypothetical protein